MGTRSKLIIAIGISAASIAGLAIWQQQAHISQKNGQIIEKAISTQDKTLCQKVTETTRPGPNDEPIRVTGKEAVVTCEMEVELGHRIRGG